jgi:hypothetical protein
MNATTCPKCSHGLGFNCVVCWPKAATVKMTATEYLATLPTTPATEINGHTATPWEFSHNSASDQQHACIEIHGDGWKIAYLQSSGQVLGGITYEATEANAEFICRACNAHDALIAALQEIVTLAPTGSLAQHKAHAALAAVGAA